MTTTTKTPSTPTLSTFQRYIANLAWWTDGQGSLRRLQALESKQSTPRRVPILVVSRKAYEERRETFSIRSERELQRVLRLRDAEQTVQHYIGPLQNGQRQVLTIRWHASVRPAVQAAWVAFPESLLIAAGVETGLVDVQGPSQHYFVLKQSPTSWQSLPASPLVATPERALLALGGVSTTAVSHISGETWRLMLLQGLQKVGFTAWQQSWRGGAGASNNSQFPWRPALLGIGCIAVLYGVLSTAYLVIATETAQRQLAAIGPDLDAALNAQATINQAQQQLQGLAQHQSNQVAVDQFWQTIADSQAFNAQVNSAISDFRSVTLAAEGTGATQVLTQWLQRDYVAAADFTAPVRSQPNGLERFTIEIQLASPSAEVQP
ncbi:hypothetical protein C9928_04090 [Pseudidiomarina aestuarii]|uniref:Uncharacterized protein n=1 Tax=Pseudidiomarina aestuarii TaxID=624146 RepID=A0A2T4D618_9GAMM|nr:hypothetical protein C9988_02445 [Pseudidiomarina aestuarii]PTB89261.1 hypothetical protein C9928_04090 [Pseudidiomarina aestuarii]